jgi:predicted O-linked N-acetylglucosamine transferase (SPINDLY family)
MPESADEHFARGDAFLAEGRYQEAVDAYELALGLQPGLRAALNNRGAALRKLGRDAEALASFELALRLQGNEPGILLNRAATLRALNRLDDALAAYEAVLDLRPDDAQALAARGMILLELQRPVDAILSLDRATVVRPEHAPAEYKLAVALRRLGNHGLALERFERAHALDPTLDFLLGDLILARRQVCAWRDAPREVLALSAAIARGACASTPFLLLAVLDSPALQRQAAESFARAWHPPRAGFPAGVGARRSGRLRLGYFSADFRNHAVAYLTAELFEMHDRAAFELIAFSLVPPAADAMQARLSGAFDRFIDVSGMTDAEVARVAQEIGIDIAIDLGGYTEGSRTGIFAWRAAPVQVGYHGYTGTMGSGYHDYLVADRVTVPDAQRIHYRESIARLPSFQINSRRAVGETTPTRADEGLPESGFVFCCFNNSYKITPEVFDAWMRILARTDGSVLWLSAGNPDAIRNLRREAETRNIAADRLVFAPPRDQAAHLARLRRADLILDTLPYNAATTASDGLWVGVPVLTRCGEAFAGRVAASVLHAAGLPELVTHSAEQYVELAVALAGDADRMDALRARLAANRETCLLFDSRRFTKTLESAFLTMQQRHEAGLAPESFDV